MSKSKNRHFVSQCISKNFVAPNEQKNFWMYDCKTKQAPVVKSVDRLFSKRRVWNDHFEKLLSSNVYENKLAPILKRFATQEMNHRVSRSDSRVLIQQFAGVVISNDEERNIVTKLLLQPVLLQAALKQSGIESDVDMLEKFYQADLASQFNVVLMENNPRCPSVPLVLMDNMLFVFFTPTQVPNTLGKVNYFFPISTYRFLLWTSSKEDCEFFCRKYSNIHELNLERISQQNKECQIATQNKDYLDFLIPQIEKYQSKEQISIQGQRQWS